MILMVTVFLLFNYSAQSSRSWPHAPTVPALQQSQNGYSQMKKASAFNAEA